jgi:nucleoid-associated protein YgaU
MNNYLKSVNGFFIWMDCRSRIFITSILMLISFWGYHPTLAHGVDNLCVVHDNETAECNTLESIKDGLAFYYGAVRAQELIEILKRWGSRAGLDLDKNTWFVCSSNGIGQIDLELPIEGETQGFSAFRPPTTTSSDHPEIPTPNDSDRLQMVDRCMSGLRSLANLSISGGEGDAYQNTVERTVAQVENELDNCYLGVQNVTPSPASGYIGLVGRAIHGIGHPVLIVAEMIKYYIEISTGVADARRGSADAAAGKKPQDDDSDYMKFYDMTVEALKRSCDAGSTESCDKLAEIEKPDEPKPDPKPDDPKPDDPKPDPTPSTPHCFEPPCADNYCEAMRQWWSRFKKECDRMNWRNYGCMSFIAGMNGNCPDPAVVRPSPNGDYVCHRPMSEDEARAAFAHLRCEEQGKMSTLTPVNEHLEPVCYDLADMTIEEAFAEFMKRECLSMYDDMGLCFNGMPSGKSSHIVGPDLPDGIVIKRNILVRTGDSLSKIAKLIYGNTVAWPQLYNANRSIVGGNPDLIVPGQILEIP